MEDTIRPKSVARELFERGMTMREYVADYGLKRAEGVLLRYLSDAYKTLLQTVPISAATDDVEDLIDWLGVTVRSVDSSLIDEWERLRNPPDDDLAAAARALPPPPPDITTNRRAFRVMVRNQVFSWVQWLARRDHQRFADVPSADRDDRWTVDRLATTMSAYWEDHDELRTDGAARGAQWFAVTEHPDHWDVHQVLLEPVEDADWSLDVRVDLVRSREEERPVIQLVRLGPTGA